MSSHDEEIALSKPMRRAWLGEDERSVVYRSGDVVMRETGPWTTTVHSLLNHLEAVGFAYSPRVIGSGFTADGRETLSFIEGETINPKQWSMEGAAAVGRMLRELHGAAASFRPSPDAIWPPWFGRELGDSDRIISHCDVAPWNIITRNGLPVGLIDWEYAGPVDPLIELAQTCWLNARLFSDDVAEREALQPLADRARQVGVMLDAYGLSLTQRRGFFDLIIEFVIHDTAYQADEAGVTHDSTDNEALWGLAWRERSAAWLLSNRKVIEQAIRLRSGRGLLPGPDNAHFAVEKYLPRVTHLHW